MSYDARAIKLLSPGEHLTSPDHPGLRLVASAKLRTWIYRYKSPVDAKMRQIKIGAWPAMPVHSAIVAWEALRDKRASGVDPAQEEKARKIDVQKASAQKARRAKEKSYTVFDVANDYWEGHVYPSRAKKGSTEIRRMFDTMLGDTGQLPAAEITRAQAFDLIKKFADKAPVQAGKLRAELGAAWDYVIDAGRLPETAPNWWRLIMRGKVRSKGKMISGQRIGTAKRVLSAAEVGALIRWLPNFTQLLEDVLTLYFWTCTRGAEIVGMRGVEIAKEDDGLWWWTIPKARTKNARHQDATDLRVPLFGRALSTVLRRREIHGSGPLFPAKSPGVPVPVQQKTIQATVFYHQPYCETRPDLKRPRLPVSHWAPHDLRRTSRTLLASLGCPDAVGESILGHMLPGVMGVYNQYGYDAERAEWLKRLAEHLERLAEVS